MKTTTRLPWEPFPRHIAKLRMPPGHAKKLRNCHVYHTAIIHLSKDNCVVFVTFLFERFIFCEAHAHRAAGLSTGPTTHAREFTCNHGSRETGQDTWPRPTSSHDEIPRRRAHWQDLMLILLTCLLIHACSRYCSEVDGGIAKAPSEKPPNLVSNAKLAAFAYFCH